MFAKRFWMLSAAIATICLVAVDQAEADKKPEKKVEKKKEVWTDPDDPTLPADFRFQGEYTKEVPARSHAPGCQVIALGNGYFQAVFHEGLPGRPNYLGEQGPRYLMEGKRDGDKVVLTPVSGKRKYLAQSPAEFVAITKLKIPENFPKEKPEAATISDGKIKYGLTELRKVVHKSHTLGQKAPAGAIVLFDGSNKDEWNGGRIDKKTGLLNTDGADITTKRKFSNYTVHVEFMLPFRPDARGQGRGNSGFYQVDHYEVQILDSFGLEGRNNECGGVYSQIDPKLNMCLPPLQWQTYDIDFTNAVRDDTGKKIKNSRLTVKLNGVVIHDNVELKGVTGGARMEPEGTPGLLRLQGHGNPLQFKNIWIVEKK